MSCKVFLFLLLLVIRSVKHGHTWETAAVLYMQMEEVGVDGKLPFLTSRL